MAKMIDGIETVDEEEMDSTSQIVDLLATHAGDIGSILELIAVARKSGIIDFLEALLERKGDATEVIVEEATKEQNMRFIRNILTIYTLLSRVNPDILRAFMENAAHSIEKSEEFRKEGSLGLLKINSQLKDPDVSAGLRVLISLAKGFTRREKDQ